MPTNHPIEPRLVRYCAVAVGVQFLVAILAVCFSHVFGFTWTNTAFTDLDVYFR